KYTLEQSGCPQIKRCATIGRERHDGQRRRRGGAARSSESLCCLRAADLGVTRLDYGVDEIATPVIGQEGALHGVDSDLFEVLEVQSKGIRSGLEFFGHGGVAHQPVVGVEGDAKFLLIQNLKRMLGQAARSTSMDVAEQANLQRNPFVENVLREVTQFHCLAVRDGNVID